VTFTNASSRSRVPSALFASTPGTNADGGGQASDTLTVNVQYAFTGFIYSVDNPPILNVADAGSTIAVKFSLGGDYGLDIFAAGYPASSQMTCDALTEDAIEETVPSGMSLLTYKPETDRYTYAWKTEASRGM
jgi:hypothetical protein